eukprot:gene39297-48555_t
MTSLAAASALLFSDEHNPLGPGIKHTEILGVEGSIDMWSTWFKYCPDAIYVYDTTSGSLDPNTGIVTSSTTYTNHFTRVLDGVLPHVVRTYLPVNEQVTSLPPRDDLDCMLDAYFHDCMSEENSSSSPPQADSPVAVASISRDVEGDAFQTDRLPSAFTTAREDDLEVMSMDAASDRLLRRVPTVTYIPARSSASTPLSLLPTAPRDLSPLKRVAEVCVFDGCLTLPVDGEGKINHFEYTFSAQ